MSHNGYQHKLLLHHFGDLPSGWDVVSLGDIFEERLESNSDLQTYPLYSFTIERGVTPKTERYERSFLLKDGNLNEYKLAYPNDFVINPMNLRFGAIGYSRANRIVSISAYYDVLRIKRADIDIDFLEAFLSSKTMNNIFNRVAIGSLIEKQRVHYSEFKRLRIFLPPENEQRRIGDIVRGWDKAITTTESLIEAKLQSKSALMQRFLIAQSQTSSASENGFRLGWHAKSLGAVAAVNPSRRKLSGAMPREVSFVSMNDVSENGTIVRQQRRSFAEVSNGYTWFEEGDVLVAKITPCFENGKGALVPELLSEIGFGSTEFHVIRPHAGINASFLFHHTRTYEFRKRGELYMEGSAGQKRVPQDFIEKYKILLPPLRDQGRIASVLNHCDKEVALLRARVTALSRQKRGLIRRLVRGQVRTKNANSNSQCS